MLTVNEIETPALVIDEATALSNIQRLQAHCDSHGLKFRPHIKTHKTVHFARAQVAAGAAGINCQKIAEAEVMAAAGFDDILITYNVVGAGKRARLRALAETVTALTVTADSDVVVAGLAETFASAVRPLSVLVECDTGGARCGVQTPEAAVALARIIAAAPGLTFGGLMTYPAAGGQEAVLAFMRAAKAQLAAAGLACPTVSSGGTPDMWQADGADVLTEYRAGTYIYNDRSLVSRKTCGWNDCAAHVVATVVSVPAAGRAIIDAGSKVLTSDLLGQDGYGAILDHQEARIVGLNEEHGIVHHGAGDHFQVGDRVRIVPNHICVVVNMLDAVWLQKASGEVVALPVDARGLVT